MTAWRYHAAMMRSFRFVICLAFALPGGSQTFTRQNVATLFGFENSQPGLFPAGWGGGPVGSIFADNEVAHTGKFSARIERTSSTASTFSSVTQAIPVDFSGKVIEWRGFIKTENVSDSVALWCREDGAGGVVGFATLQGLGVKGTADWKEYSITLPWRDDAQQLAFGFLLSGTGKAWVDDLQLLVDGVPVARAPNKILTVLDTDHEFDNGSAIALTTLSDTQVENLATLARVWGFLKYHHPAIAAGQRHWDYELFRILPRILAAGDTAAAKGTLADWVASLGAVPACAPCATLVTSDLHLNVNIDWISDESLLGPVLSQSLKNTYRNRSPAAAQFYVSIVKGIGNPSFDHELAYPSLKFPDAGYQLLALFRFWNMVQYFYPNREIMADDPAGSPDYWRQVLTESIPAIALARDSLSYQQELMRFIARIHDTHANLWSSIAARPPIGACYLPVDLQFVEGSPVVLRNTSALAGPASGLLRGDAIERLDGVDVSELVTRWTPLYADSNQAARLRDIAWYLTRGSCGPTSIVVKRGDQTVSLTPSRLAASAIDFSATYTHDLPGPAFQMLSPEVAYLKLSSVKVAESAKYVQAAAGAKGLIIDIRNYPSEFVVFSLGSLLVPQPTNFVRFTFADIANPAAFHWAAPLSLVPAQPQFTGRIVILVDEITQSQAEYTTMAFRTAPGAIVIGSTTAGADGDVSTVTLPGGLSSYISGIGVFYPDKRPTQRVGIVPDVVVKPTIAGIRAGRDELIEEAIRRITAPRRRPVGHR